MVASYGNNSERVVLRCSRRIDYFFRALCSEPFNGILFSSHSPKEDAFYVTEQRAEGWLASTVIQWASDCAAAARSRALSLSASQTFCSTRSFPSLKIIGLLLLCGRCFNGRFPPGVGGLSSAAALHPSSRPLCL